jgi:Viral BACON domain
MQILLTVTGETEQPGCDNVSDTPWLSLDPAAGTVAAGASQPVAVRFDSGGRAVGDRLEAELCLLSNDPDRALVVVPLEMRVAAIPEIDVTPDALAARQQGGTVPAQGLTIGNTGNGPLEWEVGEAGSAGCAAPSDVPWLSVSPAAGATPAGESSDTTVSFEVTGLATGDHQARLCVTNNDPADPVVEVPVTVTVTVTCDVTITGVHPEPLTVTGGVTCLAPGSRVEGQVNVFDGAGLAANTAVIQGPLATFGATTVELLSNQVIGPVSIRGTSGSVTMSGTRVIGSVLVVDNRTGGTPIVVTGNSVVGSLFCTSNQPPPTDSGMPNTVIGGMKLDQCAGL